MTQKVLHSAKQDPPKSLYTSFAGGHFYGTENEIWAGFGPVGNTKKKLGVDNDSLSHY